MGHGLGAKVQMVLTSDLAMAARLVTKVVHHRLELHRKQQNAGLTSMLAGAIVHK